MSPDDPTDPNAPPPEALQTEAPADPHARGEFAAITPPPDPDAILPPAYSESDLREAVGVSPRPEPKLRAPSPDPLDDDEDDEPDDKRRRRKTIAVVAISVMVGLSIAGLVFLGRANTSRYLIVCASDHVSAEQGRAFPPWGSKELSGPEWKPIALPPNAECKGFETDEPVELEQRYLDLLFERATAILTTPNLLDSLAPVSKDNPRNALDVAADQLQQALLLSRNPERRSKRQDIERLLGDVEYWRASLKLRVVSAALADAKKQFEAAGQKKPLHVSDAYAWGSLLGRITDELHAGPAGVTQSPFKPDDKPAVPQGVALPVEPAGSAASPDVTPPAPDAGVPSGGVLL